MEVLRKFVSKKYIIILFIIIAIVSGLIYYFKFRTVSTDIKQQFASVSYGQISSSIKGTGTLISSDKTDISARVSGTILKVNFKEGDKVKAGDIIFEMDDTDGIAKVRQLNDSINQAKITSNNNLSSIYKLNLTAPFSGQISNIQVKTGDITGKNSTILTLTDLSKLKIQIPFNASAIGVIKVNQPITLYIADIMQSVTGKIVYANNKAFPSTSGGQIFFVEALIDNPGSLSKGMKASGEVISENGIIQSTDYGIFDYQNSSVIKCDAGGIVTNVNVKDSQFVNEGDLLVQFKNDDLELSRESYQSKLADLDKQLGDANKQLENYKVSTPVDGVITKQTMRVGDVLKQGDVASSVSNNLHMEFSISFDELDIAKVAVGQKTLVTIDALPETLTRPMIGTVSKIALEGTTSSGVTTYPVTISLEGNDRLKLGMNANAQVMVLEKNDILRLPIAAVQKRGNRAFVMVIGSNDSGTTAFNSSTSSSSIDAQGNAENRRNRNQNSGQNIGEQGNSNRQNNGGSSGNNSVNNMWAGNAQVQQYYANAVQKVVEVGISNENFIEIVSGLNEGDRVLLPPVIATQATTNTNNPRTGVPGMGGIGGGGFGGGNAGNRNQGNNQRR
jgi:HlyD family secretion protein